MRLRTLRTVISVSDMMRSLIVPSFVVLSFLPTWRLRSQVLLFMMSLILLMMLRLRDLDMPVRLHTGRSGSGWSVSIDYRVELLSFLIKPLSFLLQEVCIPHQHSSDLALVVSVLATIGAITSRLTVCI